MKHVGKVAIFKRFSKIEILKEQVVYLVDQSLVWANKQPKVRVIHHNDRFSSNFKRLDNFNLCTDVFVNCNFLKKISRQQIQNNLASFASIFNFIKELILPLKMIRFGR